MRLTSKKDIRRLLQKYNVQPSKGLGQNFLINDTAFKKIIEAGELKPNDTILEIGPGVGNLTQKLAEQVKKVVAVEKDKKMISILKETLKDFKNIEIIQEDILTFEPKKLGEYKIIANLPFYLTSPVIRKFLEIVKNKPKSMILVTQKEVGQRICAKPPNMSILAVSIQFYATPKIISYISKGSFWPQPKVNSSIIKISSFKKVGVPISLFFKIVKAGFSHPRKQLANNLSKELKINRNKINDWLLKNNVQPTRRAETLDIESWLNLTKTLE